MNTVQQLREIMETTIRAHGPSCIFKVDTIERCVNAGLFMALQCADKISTIDAIGNELISCELFCPHEGINRMPTI